MATGSLYLSQDSQAFLLSLELQKGKKKHKQKQKQKQKQTRGTSKRLYQVSLNQRSHVT